MRTRTHIAMLLADPRVAKVWSENNGCFEGDGPDWWVELKPGFVLANDWTHTIHEPTLRDCQRELKRVVPCRRACCGGNEGPAL